MRRRKSGVGAELAPLILILACLAGAFGSIIAAYRRVQNPHVRSAPPPVAAIAPAATTSAVAAPPAPIPLPPPEPGPVPAAAPQPAPVDPTVQALAPLHLAEAEQLLEASQANLKAQGLEAARQAAQAESERWRRRQSLIHSQISTLESKVRRVEVNLDSMALERDALERELDARKAAIAQAKSRPGQAILPHKGPNGTWRRPIVVECRNGAAVIQPQGVEFGLYDLENGFGPVGNRFVNAIARESIRVQRSASPDGAPVVPYIFFLVRPDGIRPYYEARGRLEPLGITFGYELADADWEIEFPDLDEVGTWDGSAPRGGASFATSGPSPERDAEEVDLPTWPGARSGPDGPGGKGETGPFTFGPARLPGGSNSPLASFLGRPLGASEVAGSGLTGSAGASSGSSHPASGDVATLPRPPASRFSGPGSAGLAVGSGGGAGQGEVRRTGPGAAGTRVDAAGRIVPGVPGFGPNRPSGALAAANRGGDERDGPELEPARRDRSGSPAPRDASHALELALDGPTADASTPAATGGPAEPSADPTVALDVPKSDIPAGSAGSAPILDPARELDRHSPAADPADTFVWSGDRDGSSPGRPASDEPAGPGLDLAANGAGRSTPASKGTNAGSTGRVESADPGAGAGDQAARRMLGRNAQAQRTAADATQSPPRVAEAVGLGLPSGPPPPPVGSPPSPQPNLPEPPGSLASPPVPINLLIPPHPPTHAEIADAVQRQTSPTAPPRLDAASPAVSFVDRTFEVVAVCGPKGVIVQPGTYRITAEALQDREGLFKKQVVALVKAHRAARPAVQVEPRLRFLIQPGGYSTYQAARAQFFVSGLTWPTTTELANPDPLAITTSGVR